MKFPGAGGNRYIVGMHIGDESSGLTYCFPGAEPVTVSTVTGEEEYAIPTALAKLPGGEHWAYGAEALRAAQEEGAILVDHLLSRARDGEPMRIEGKSYPAVNLLTLFLSRLLGLLAPIGGSDKMEALLVTAPEADPQGDDALREAVLALDLKTSRISVQGLAESFYSYMIHQDEQLRRRGALLLELDGEEMRVLRMGTNPKTTPVVVRVSEESYPFPTAPRTNAPDEAYERQQHDRMLLNLSREVCAGAVVSCICLVGERFGGGWAEESTRYLCSQARVFLGSNLYSKGACYALADRLWGSEAARRYVFLGRDKLTANIGMRLLRQGEEVYLALLDAGTDWFDASESVEFYLQGGSSFDIQISSLVGGGSKQVRITLEDLPEHLTRLRATFSLTDARTLAVRVEDLGFGEIHPPGEREWNEVIEL